MQRVDHRLCIHHWCRICCIGLFWIMLAAPLVVMGVMPVKTVSQNENRNLAEFPKLQANRLNAYFRGIESYWNDHIGFRDALTFIYNYILWAGFDQSGFSWVTVGKSGWFFFGGDQSNEDVLGKVVLRDADLKQWAGVIQAKKDWFDRQNIRYVFVLAPNKQSVYPEYLPDWMRRHAVSVRRIDRLVEVLRKHTDVEIIDLRDALLREKDREPVFFRTDSHWNWQGAYAAYRQVIDRLHDWFPDMEPLPKSRMTEIVRDFRHGDLRMGLDGVIWEKERVWLPAEPCSKWNGTAFDRYLYEKRCGTGRTRAIVLRDSYMDFVEPYLSEHFGDVVYIWKRWAEDSGTEHRLYKEWIEKMRPDLVIEERVERLVGQIPAVTMEQRFDYADPVLGHWDGTIGFDGIEPYHQVRLEPENGGLLIFATGNDPGVRLPEMGQNTGPLIIRIEIESPADTVLQMFYATDEKSGYSEAKSRKMSLEKGVNTVFLCIEEPAIQGQLRLDPGYAIGTYRLQSIEIRKDQVASLLQAYDAGRMSSHARSQMGTSRRRVGSTMGSAHNP
ncbi:alginate O-acetyltransferase AlgX-related protein [Desulfatirhabdium butyrativorans]|uniref:alginate O-acetyltransferase AlgX-related protein n=1 Tax=Desulfatirhabdium butyrativorans TaxID=340467 RepID=UPI0004032564|nr:hypothetical protein [Desulfatirhabdium butyrativorans]